MGLRLYIFFEVKVDSNYFFNKNSNRIQKIISPHDKGIAKCILESLTPLPESWETQNVDNNPLRFEPFDEVYKNYFEDLTKSLCFHR